MDWLAQNWFWVALIGLFVGMHMFGHGGCGGHAHHKASDDGNARVSGDTVGEAHREGEGR